jgi:hypothetical protein
MLVMPRGCISLLVTLGMPDNSHTESILFDVVEVSRPFNAILGRPALYQFMGVAHYGYLVLKMPFPNGMLKIRRERNADISASEKLQALAAQHEAVARPGGRDHEHSSTHQHSSSSAPHVQPSGSEDVPVKTIQIRMNAT